MELLNHIEKTHNYIVSACSLAARKYTADLSR